MEDQTFLCMCDSLSCDKSIQLPLEEALEVFPNGLVLIVDGCVNGPSATDKFVEKREGYTLYREEQPI